MRPTTTLLTLLGMGLLTATGVAVGCSGDSGANAGGAGPGGTAAGGNDGGNGAGGDLGFDAGTSDAPLDPDSACAATEAEATLTKKPVDIIFVIDNSGSMTDEIVSVQNNINDNFASIIGASGVDYRVIMLAEHGEAVGPESICVKAPLSGTDCNPVPAQPVNNPPIFFHYSRNNESHDSLCHILDSYNGGLTDQFGVAPNGWSEWLRDDSVKVFVEITDDNVNCSTTHLAQNVSMADGNTQAGGDGVATKFETALFALQPAYFGDAMERNYIFYSIVGLSDNNPATDPWQPADPVQLGHCSTAVAAGTGYQALSILTGGLRFPLCEFGSYDAVFQAIAAGVISEAKVACEFPVPDPPPGETIDLSTVVVRYSPGDGGADQSLTQVAGAADCAPSSFYIEDSTIKLCPDACTVVQGDTAAKLAILYGCKSSAR